MDSTQQNQTYFNEGEPSSSTYGEAGQSTAEHKVYCPVCNKKFPILDIELHVDICLESKRNPITIYDSENEEEDFEQIHDEVKDDLKPSLTKCCVIKSVGDIVRLKCKMSSEEVTLNIRTRFCFADFFKHFSKKWNHMKKDFVYKIMFVGEAGLDTGGVSREFYSGAAFFYTFSLKCV